MLFVRKKTLKLPENEGDLFGRLYLDTIEMEYVSAWNRYLIRERVNLRPWVGKVDRDRREFRVRSISEGTVSNSISDFELSGNVKHGVTSKELELTISFHWHGVLEKALAVGLAGTIAFRLMDILFGSIMWILITALIVVSAYSDLNKSEEKLLKYLEPD